MTEVENKFNKNKCQMGIIQMKKKRRKDKKAKRTIEVLEENNLFYFFFLATPHGTWILVPKPGIKPARPEVEVWSLNHWTSREVPEENNLEIRKPFPVMISKPWNIDLTT